MIMADDKRRIATIMASRKSAKGEDLGAAPMKPEIVKHEDGEIDGRHVAMKDFLAGVHEKSPEKMMHALGNFHDLHMSMKDSGESPSEE